MNQHVTFPKQKPRSPTVDEIAVIRRLARDGKHDAVIGEMVGRSRQSVRSIRRKLGLPAALAISAWSNAELDDLERLHAAGCSDAEIASHVGRTRDAVRSQREARGIGIKQRAPKAPKTSLTRQRPCPIDAEYEERTRANVAYLLAGLRAGHEVFTKGRGPE